MIIQNVSIDVMKIDKAKLIEGKNGAKYYSCDIILSDTPNQYGQDVSVSTAQTKEERAEKAKRHYIGNGKKVFDSNLGGVKVSTAQPIAERSQPTQQPLDDLPF